MGYNPPKTKEDKEKLYYGPNDDGVGVNLDQINQYEKYLRNPDNKTINPDGMNKSEREIKEFLSKLGKIKKIKKENDYDTPPDFEVEHKNLFFEVKSINTVYNEESFLNDKDETKWLEKINFLIEDILKKKEVPENAIYFGVIYIDFVQMTFGKGILTLSFVEKTKFRKVPLTALLIYPQESSITIQTPVLFSKSKKLLDLFKKQYGSSELEMNYLAQ